MKDFKYILFDLDGTITDPGEGITNSVAYSLNTYGIEVADKRELYPFIGPPLFASYMKYYGFSEEKALEAVDRYREYYSVKGVFECSLYTGMEKLLKALSEAGKTLIVATSKPEYFARQVLAHFGVDEYFHHLAGATMDSHRIEKADIIRLALSDLGITDVENAVMIGDREFDVLGAKENKMVSIGVTYGYGSREELENAGADLICDSVEELISTLISQNSGGFPT